MFSKMTRHWSCPVHWTVAIIVLLAIFHWNSATAQQQSTCGYPGSPAHASVILTSDKMTPGTVATYTCDNGYELLGPSRRTCQQNGTWTPLGIPFCVLNVAVGKAAMQSSSVGQGSAQKAVDGSTSSFYKPSTCTMTEAEQAPWFYVNLLEPVLVQLVRIDFGASCCGGNRPAVITVRVGNNRPDLGVNPVCRKFTGFIEEGRPLFLPCTRPMPGAFVSITLESHGSPLSICEIFVYTDHALSIEQCPTFRDQPLGGTSTYDGKCYIFYNEHPLTFDNAKRFCEMRGGTLVDETSPALQGFLSWELYRRHRNDPNGQYWLGAVRDPQSPLNWKWINGKDVTISFWNLPGSRENCSRFDGTKGWLWSDTSCTLKLNYMCQHRPLSCGRPERPANSTLLARSVDVGQTIEYRCNEGSLLSGPNIRTCLPNGFFSEYAPRCKYVECGYPASIANGQYSLNNSSRAYLSTVTYSCVDGFVLVGRANLACDADARWNGPPPRCEPVLCPSPPLIAHGYATLTSNSTRFGSVVEYRCDSGYELVGDSTLQCNMVGYWDGQPGYCIESRPSTVTSTTTTTPSTTTIDNTVPNTVPTTTINTFFDNDLIRYSNEPTNSIGKKPQIALLPVASNGGSTTVAQQSTLGSSPSTSSSTTTTTTSNGNPYTRLSSSSSTANTTPTNFGSIRHSSLDTLSTYANNPTGVSSSVSTTTTTTTSTTSSPPTSPFRKVIHHHHRLSVTTRPHVPIVRVQDNEISDTFMTKPSKMAAARLNMGGIIALGIFGGFVFLAAVITIIVIIIRRVKHSHSSLDAQTISTFDSSNGDNPGFYHKYASAWSQLQNSAAVLHSGSYKPSMARLDIPYDQQQHHHHFHSAMGGGGGGDRRQRSPNGGAINEGFRDTNEITLNADVYSRSAERSRFASNNGANNKSRGSGSSPEHDWQHLTRGKY